MLFCCRHATWWATTLMTMLPVLQACAARHSRQSVKCSLPCMWLQMHRVVALLTAWARPGSVMVILCNMRRGCGMLGLDGLQHCQNCALLLCCRFGAWWPPAW